MAALALVALVLVTLAGPAGQWPVTPVTIVRAFDPPAQDWLAGHRGVDLAARTGQPVRSMAAGTVAFVGSVAGIPVVSVRYADGRRSTYEPVVGSVTTGQSVAVGAVLGEVAARGGHCGGEVGCLHVGLIEQGSYLDPELLVRRPPAVLKPWGAPARTSSAVVPATRACTAASWP